MPSIIMKTLVCLLVFVYCNCCAQEDTFRVQKAISISPDLDTLLGGHQYIFSLSGIDMATVPYIRFTEGKVQKTNTGFILTVNKVVSNKRKYAVELYVPGGKELNMVFAKEFTLMAMADMPKFEAARAAQWINQPPQIYAADNTNTIRLNLTGTDTISVGECRLLTHLEALDFNTGPIPVQSFTMQVQQGGVTKSYTGNSRFSAEILKALSGIKSGSLLTFSRVLYSRTGGSPDASVAGPFKLLVK